MSDFKHSIALTGEEIVESGEGFPFSWETLAEVFSAALLKEGHMMESEEVFQIDISESGINLIVRDRK